jgi:TRAP-type C4-dicarboxylate transport system substrate-binding protein
MMNRVFCVIGIVFLASALFFWTADISSAQSDKPIVLKAVTTVPVGTTLIKPFQDFYIAELKKRSNGRLLVDLKGGREAIPEREQVDALSAGVVDMVINWAGAYDHILPEVAAHHLTQYSPREERASGAFDYWVMLHKRKVNAQYLGRWAWGIGYNFYLREKRVSKLSDFKGLKLMEISYCAPFIKELGATPIDVSGPNVYTAMQRGVIDGFMWSQVGLTAWGWPEVTKYVLDPPFSRMDLGFMMNLDKFNALPKDLQDVLINTAADFEGYMEAQFVKQAAVERGAFEKAGAVYVELPKEEQAYYLKGFDEASWKELEKTLPSGSYNELRKALIKP